MCRLFSSSFALVLCCLIANVFCFNFGINRIISSKPSSPTSNCRRFSDECTLLFQKSPEIRKIIKTYLKRKFFGNDGTSYTINKDKTIIQAMLYKILPPSASTIEINEAVANIFNTFGCEACISEDKYISSLLCNSLWNQLNEVVVKELVYIDSIVSSENSECSVPLLSEHCFELLHNSLLDCGSTVPLLDVQDIMFLSASITLLNSNPSDCIFMNKNKLLLLEKSKQSQNENVKAICSHIANKLQSTAADHEQDSFIDNDELIYLDNTEDMETIFDAIMIGLKRKQFKVLDSVPSKVFDSKPVTV